MRTSFSLRVGLSLLLTLAVGCDGGGQPSGWRETPTGTGPMVVWDPFADDLPLMPLPNDTATWPDPSSPTGRRINASMVVPTLLEQRTRELFDQLDGWGTFAPISVAFEDDLDLTNLLDRQGGADHFSTADFAGHAIYLIDMNTGLPAPIDLASGSFPYATTRPDQYFDHDPRSGESNVLFETVEEDANGNGVFDPGEDTDFDGIFDHPNTLDGRLTGDPLETVDRMAWFYERETKTLILRPMVPLNPRTTYAVVLTDRLVGEDGAPVRSPFDHVHHVRQMGDLADLPQHLSAHPELYGDLATRGWDGVAFAWTFTTQSVTDDLDVVREGLYGRGVMARLDTEFPVDVAPLPMQGGRGCPVPGEPYITPGDAFRTTLATVAVEALGLPEASLAAMLASYQSLSHVVTVVTETPYFFFDPNQENREDVFDMDWRTGEARITREPITINIFVPNEDAEHAQPFDPVVYVHGHGSNAAEVLLYGGLVLQHGQALVAINAHGHGLDLGRAERNVIRGYFAENCIEGTADALTTGRARDLNGDGSLDSGADFWTAYVFHTRDSVRQTVIDQMQVFRILRSFDGTRRAAARTVPGLYDEPVVFDGDYDGDGAADLAGDFDADGTPDLGGPNVDYRMAGGSLGGIITALTAGVEPNIVASAPVVGGGGLADVAVRTENGAVIPAMLLRLMGPFVVGNISAGPSSASTCAAGDLALQILGTNLTDDERTEFACVPAAQLSGDDVLVVRNYTNGEVRCAGATGGVPGAFRVGIPSDVGDYWSVEYYRHALLQTDFGTCTIEGDPVADRIVDTWETGFGSTGANRCGSCAHFASTEYEMGSALVAPTAGYGRRRQTPEFRRLVMLAQVGLERGDPINYVRRIFLDPLVVEGVEPRPRSILIVNTDGDPNVPIATGYSMARAAGVIPFLPPDAPDHLADFRAPPDFAAARGFTSPNDLLIAYHAIEGLPRLERHPAGPGGERFLADIDNLAEGRAFFATDGETQISEAEGGLLPVTVTPGLRWSRRSRRMSSPTDLAVWTYEADMPNSGMVAPYVQPAGIHGFSGIFDETVGFDMAVYMFNMLSRYIATNGTDIPYLSDPDGHHCLEDSSCSYLTE